MYLVAKKAFDIIASLLVILCFSWLLIILILLVALTSKGGAFYRQIRVGQHGKEFGLLKFRSMRVNSDKVGQITIGNDSRVTPIGRFLRKSKLDELPQLFNILLGQMSVVGPRPEVPKYVSLYNEEQKKVLEVKPGLTDLASLKYIKEQELLGKSEDPGTTYINEIMPAKLALNFEYIEKRNFWFDLKLILQTIGGIF